MGQRNSHFSKDELDEYADLVYLTRSEILKVYDKFASIDPIRVGQNRNAKISSDRIVAATEELRLNPFGDRICHVFSSENDGSLSFEDFLDLYSTFSGQASRDVKTTFAFRIYDFDNDGLIGRDDIREVVDRLVFDDDKHLTREEKVRVVENVLRECDNDEDGALCFPEFQQAMAKSPDFIQLFKMYI